MRQKTLKNVKFWRFFEVFADKIVEHIGIFATTKLNNTAGLCVSMNTVSSELEAAASNFFDKILAQNLLSKKCVLLRLLFEGGFYLRAASNTEFTVFGMFERKRLSLDCYFWREV